MRTNEGGGGEIFTFILLGVGGYFLWEWFMSQQSTNVVTGQPSSPASVNQPTSVAVPNQTTTATGTTTQVTTNTSPTPTKLTTTQLNSLNNTLSSWMQTTGYDPTAQWNGYQWQYFAQHAYGSAYHQTVSVVGTTMYNLTSFILLYAQDLSNAGLTGLGCACGGDLGLGVLQSEYMYQKLNNKRGGWAVGSFAAPMAGRYEGI